MDKEHSKVDIIIYLLLFLFNAIFIILWSTITINRFLSMHSDVYDLGVAMEQGWLVFHTHWTFNLFFISFGYYSGRFILSPLFLFGSYKLILIAQAVAMSVGSVFIFLISKKMLQNNIISFFISLLYLFFPFTNSLLFDFHYMIFFIPLFLAGFYLYLCNKYISSIIVMIIAGLMKFPFLIFPLIVFFVGLIELLLNSYKIKVRPERKESFYYLVGLFAFSIVLIFTYLSIKGNLGGYIHSSTNSSVITSIFLNFNNKIITVVMVLSFLLFLPIRSKYFLLSFPFFAYLFIYNYGVYPDLLVTQYNALVFPVLFIAFIDSLRKIKISNKSIMLIKKWKFKKIDVKIITIIMILLIIFIPVFDVYGPYNHYIEPYNNINSDNVNMTMFNDMEHAISLIPKNISTSSILVENDVPLIFPRLDIYGLNASNNLAAPMEVDAVGSFFYNFTEIGPHSHFYPIHPEYIVMYPYGQCTPSNRIGYGNYVSFEGSAPHNISNFDIVTHLLKTGKYGILAEVDGLYILEKNYSAKIKYYVPFDRNYEATDFVPCGNSYVTEDGDIQASNVNNTTMFNGPPTALNPGNYTITYYLSFTKPSPTTSIYLSGYFNYNTGVYLSKNVNISDFKHVGDIYLYSVNFTSNSFTQGVDFNIYISHVSGSITFNYINIYQTAAFNPISSN